MTHTVQRWGNSLALRIPRRLAQSAGLSERSAVEVRREGRCIVIEPVPPPLTLEHLLAGRPVTLWARWKPTCGDVVSVRAAGEERRWTAVVLSPAAYSSVTARALVCRISEQARGGPFEVAVPERQQAGAVALADHVHRLDVLDSGVRLVGSVPAEAVVAVRERLVAILEG